MPNTHTPGPWTAEGIFPDTTKGQTFDPVVYITAQFESGKVRIADIPDVADKSTEEWANARLIAAAPRMLDLLQRTYGRCHDETVRVRELRDWPRHPTRLEGD